MQIKGDQNNNWNAIKSQFHGGGEFKKKVDDGKQQKSLRLSDVGGGVRELKVHTKLSRLGSTAKAERKQKKQLAFSFVKNKLSGALKYGLKVDEVMKEAGVNPSEKKISLGDLKKLVDHVTKNKGTLLRD